MTEGVGIEVAHTYGMLLLKCLHDFNCQTKAWNKCGSNSLCDDFQGTATETEEFYYGQIKHDG